MEKNESREKRSLMPYWAGVTLFYIAANFAHPVTPTLIIERHLDSSLFGTALAAMMFVSFLFSPFWGKLCSYVPTKRIMLFCAIGYACGQAIFGAATSEAMVIGGRMFAGIFTGGLFVSYSNYIVNTSDPEKRGQNLSILVTVQLVSGAVGYFIGGMLGLISVEAAFIAQVITLVICGIVFSIVCVDDTPFKHRPDTPLNIREVNPFSAFASAKDFMTPMLALIFIIIAVGGIGYNSFEQCFNYYIKDQFGMSSAYNGTIKAVIAIAILIANSTIGLYLQNKTDKNKSFMPLLCVTAVLLISVLLVHNKIYFIGSYVVFSACNSIRMALLQTMTAARADSVNSNSVMGFYQAMNSLGSIFGALFAGLIYAKNPMYPFYLAAIAFIIASVFAAVYVKKYKAEKK